MEFPPLCNCVRNSSESPFSLQLDSIGTPTGFFRYCFKVRQAGLDSCAGAISDCCNNDQGVNKVEFEANFDCKPVLRRVTVDGQSHTAWEFNKLGVVRVTALNRTFTTSNGTEVCLFLRADNSTSCSRIENFCTIGAQGCKYAIFQTDRSCCPVGMTAFYPPPPMPPITPGFNTIPPPPPSPGPSVVPIGALPPPPPPPRSNFPNCTCVKDMAASQLYVKSNATVFPFEKNFTKICFQLGVKDTCSNPASPCCKYNVHKVELEADPKCAPFLSYQTVDGERRTRSFQYNPYPTIKFTGISKSFDEAEGTELCLIMKPGGCSTVKEVAGSSDGFISASVFNNPAETENCCPTNYYVAQAP
ncbi:hypothetical protein PLESTB_001671300 [Pleodorina starrii]|uniref:Pherophorin domain-containing protein n=1 Tax=Pleodorina starrii TaxID=330485 RepID=A0A9W6BZS7_9CHLO|nr:hypothetical protein PLESTB_001671300 [Pleodorina starrii]